MDTPYSQSNPSPSVIFHDEIIFEILSWLTVKLLMQMKCVCKSWKAIISDPKFIQIHLIRSSKNPHVALISKKKSLRDHAYRFIPYPISSLLENHCINLLKDPYYRLKDKDCCKVVGSYNGLVCLIGYSLAENNNSMWLRFWNPATRKISDKLGYLHDGNDQWDAWNFVFGYDSLTKTYKVVMLNTDGNREVKVFSLSDNIWKCISNFPMEITNLSSSDSAVYGGVHLNCTVNWLATNQEYVIISLDLGTETYTQLLPPPGTQNIISLVVPSICVLMNSLCFFHDSMGTDFVIWKMTKFGDDQSWTRFLKLSYRKLGKNYNFEPGLLRLKLMPLHVSENGDTLIVANNLQNRAIIYNRRTKRAKKTKINNNICWFSMKGYVESLVSTS